VPVYDFELPTPLTNKNLIQLSRILTCPYYIKSLKEIMLLGDKEATMLSLHAHNLEQYLNNLQI
jgi:hypothetical protein